MTCGAGTGSATIQICAADDVTPSNTTAISFKYKAITAPDTQGATTETQSLVAGGASDMVYAIEVDAAKVQEVSSRKFVVLQTEEKANRPMDGAIVGFLMGMRYAEDQNATQAA